MRATVANTNHGIQEGIRRLQTPAVDLHCEADALRPVERNADGRLRCITPVGTSMLTPSNNSTKLSTNKLKYLNALASPAVAVGETATIHLRRLARDVRSSAKPQQNVCNGRNQE
jgi:hypothetical protein